MSTTVSETDWNFFRSQVVSATGTETQTSRPSGFSAARASASRAG